MFRFVSFMADGEQSKEIISTGQVRTRDGDNQGRWIQHWQTACSRQQVEDSDSPRLRIISIPRAAAAVAVFSPFLVPRDRIYPGERISRASEWQTARNSVPSGSENICRSGCCV